LAIVPNLIRKKRYSVEIQGADRSLGTFPIEREFKIISAAAGMSGVPRRAKTEAVTLKSLLPRPNSKILINFWATWCPPCLEEMPSLEFLNRKLTSSKDNKLPTLVTISVDTAAQAVTSLFPTMDLKPTFLVLHDPDGKFSSSVGTTK